MPDAAAVAVAVRATSVLRDLGHGGGRTGPAAISELPVKAEGTAKDCRSSQLAPLPGKEPTGTSTASHQLGISPWASPSQGRHQSPQAPVLLGAPSPGQHSPHPGCQSSGVSMVSSAEPDYRWGGPPSALPGGEMCQKISKAMTLSSLPAAKQQARPLEPCSQQGLG